MTRSSTLWQQAKAGLFIALGSYFRGQGSLFRESSFSMNERLRVAGFVDPDSRQAKLAAAVLAQG
jgi:hypothetical protein